jgi:hypothetical protein
MKFQLPYGNYFSAAPDFLMALTFLVTWIEPTALGDNMIQYLILVMLMEFITIHSSAFFGAVMVSSLPKTKKSINLILLGGFYTMFVAAFSLSSGEWWPIVAFWGLVFNRLTTVLFGAHEEGKVGGTLLWMWVAGTVCYLGGIFLTVMLDVPEFGVTYEVVQSFGMSGKGLWFGEPYRLMAFGALYFTLIGCAEIFIGKWKQKDDVMLFPDVKNSIFR